MMLHTHRSYSFPCLNTCFFLEAYTDRVDAFLFLEHIVYAIILKYSDELRFYENCQYLRQYRHFNNNQEPTILATILHEVNCLFLNRTSLKKVSLLRSKSHFLDKILLIRL